MHRFVINWPLVEKGTNDSIFSAAAIEQHQEEDLLKLLNGFDDEELFKTDLDGNYPIDLALLHHLEDDELIFNLVIRESSIFLDYNANMKNRQEGRRKTLPLHVLFHAKHAISWTKIVSNNGFARIVERVFETFPDKAVELAHACDENNRRVIDIAARPDCYNIVRRSTYLFKRFELTTDTPHHQSATCQIFLGLDYGIDDDIGSPVAIKFMTQKDQWQREINVRLKGKFDDCYVIGILDKFDGSSDPFIYNDLMKKGLDVFPYIIVMPAGAINNILSCTCRE